MLDRVRTRLKSYEYARRRRAYLKLLGFKAEKADRRNIDDYARQIIPMHGYDRSQVDHVMRGRSRTPEAVRARFHVWYTAYHIGGFPLTAIAKRSGRHHTTVLYGICRWAADKRLPCALNGGVDAKPK
jgi:hypothetical protein